MRPALRNLIIWLATLFAAIAAFFEFITQAKTLLVGGLVIGGVALLFGGIFGRVTKKGREEAECPHCGSGFSAAEALNHDLRTCEKEQKKAQKEAEKEAKRKADAAPAWQFWKKG